MSMSLDAANSNDYVGPGILDITLKSDKPLKSAKVKISTTSGFVVFREEKVPDSPQVTFRAPRELSLPTGLVLRIKYSHQLPLKRIIDVTGADLLSVYKPDGEEKQVWKQFYGKLELIVQLEDPLRPTTERILEICPKFRILVMGKVDRSGVGKSSLINKTFGVTDANVSHGHPGEANIDREIPSKQNTRFLLHDSQGFEQGENSTFNIVQSFIKRRELEPEIKEKLHAIWLCLQTPTLGGRLVETGAEEFLKLKAAGKLGDVPIIVVFTKYDRAVTTQRMAMTKAGLTSTIEEATKNAKAAFQRECIVPFEANVGKTIPHISVSTRSQYPNTLSDLVGITFELVEKYIAEAAVVTGISQRINAQVKIRASIEVGKCKHWRGLTSDNMLPGTLKNFLDVIHHDIVRVWNMDDAYDFLFSTEFKNLMLSSIDASEKLNAHRIPTIPTPISEVVSVIIQLLTGPAAPIVIPILVIGLTWVNERYRKTQTNLRRIMIYIVNLTIVMQNLFWIQNILATKPREGDGGVSDRVAVPIKRRFIKLAFNLYITAPDRHKLISQIDDYTSKVDFILQAISQDRRDATIDKIIHLVDSSTISNRDAFAQRNGRVLVFDESWEGKEDEMWDT